MPKESKRKSYGVKRVEDKYICEECQSEVPMHQACPTCNKHIEWDRIIEENRRLGV